MVSADPGADPSPHSTRTTDRLCVQAQHELAGAFGAGRGVGGPEGHQSRGVGRVRDRAPRQLERAHDLRQRVASPRALSAADDEHAHHRDVARGGDGHVQGQRLLLELELGIEAVTDQRVHQTRPRARAPLHVLLAGVQVGLGDLGRDLVQGCEDVVGGHHQGFRGHLRVAAPCPQDRVPGHTRRDPVRGEDRFHRLAAAGLEDAQLGDPPQLLGRCRPRLASGGQEQVQPGFACPRDRGTLGRNACRVVPANHADHGPRHVSREPAPAALQLGHQRIREAGGRSFHGWGLLGRRGHTRHRFDYTGRAALGPQVEAFSCSS